MVYLLIGYLYGVKVMKIGLSQNRFWQGRSDAYKTSGTWPEVIGEIEGDHYIEQEIHDKFAYSRIPGSEFFEYDERAEEIFKTGIFYRGKLYKPVIENYKEIHKQTSTFNILDNIKLGEVSNMTKKILNDRLYHTLSIEELCCCNKFEYRTFDGIWKNSKSDYKNDFYPGYIYFDIKDEKIQKIIYIRAPDKRKAAIYSIKDDYLNQDILPQEALYWSNMSLNGFISFNYLYEVISILEDLKNKRYEYIGNPLYSIWCKNKKEGD